MPELTLIGGRGYTGEALLGLVANHPELTVRRIASRSLAGRPVAEVFPDLGLDGLEFEDLAPEDCAAIDSGCVVLAVPNGASDAYLEHLGPDRLVLDLSADHRFDADWVYGLPELDRSRLPDAKQIANPGCYATAAQLALAPIIDELAAPPVVFGVSGYSGAGRTPSPRNDPKRLADNLLPYALTGHVHEREISAHLGRDVRFSPHVAAFFRGISLTVAVQFSEETSTEALAERFADFYSGERLIRVTEESPEVRDFAHRHGAGVGGFSVDRRDATRAVWVACLDNLLKGAASQALQNLNLALGLDEYMGLKT